MRRPDVHQLGDAVAVANELEELRGDERHRLGVVQTETARESLLREDTGTVEDELVDLARREVHDRRRAKLPPSPERVVTQLARERGEQSAYRRDHLVHGRRRDPSQRGVGTEGGHRAQQRRVWRGWRRR